MITKTLITLLVLTVSLGVLIVRGPAMAWQTRTSAFTQPDPIAFNDHAGWQPIFDGASLNYWEGNPEIWKLEDGAIVGTSSPAKPSGTTYIIWKGGSPRDFELKAEMKLEGSELNSGIQYRSTIVPPPQGSGGTPNLKGYQADFDFAGRYTGQLYEQGTPRRIIAWRGQAVRTETGKNSRLLATLGDPAQLGGFVKAKDWNQVHIIARGNTLTHIINGHVMSILIDDDPTMAAAQGVIGLQIEGTGKISFRNIWLKNL